MSTYEELLEQKASPEEIREKRFITLSGTQNEEYYENFAEFLKMCNDDIKITNTTFGSATKAEYLSAESTIKKILDEINPEWSTKQKLAHVHYKVGELVSYVPDFNFVRTRS